MKLPKVVLPAKVKKNLPTALFILVIPLGILVGFFFSSIKGFVSGGYKNILEPVNKMRYVAKVDGVGIPKKEWEKMLKSRYGTTAVKDLIDVYTVKNELKKAGINATEEEINGEIANIEKQLAGQSLEDILKQQGRTLTDFRQDISLQVGMKKLLTPKVTITDAEIDDYIKSAGETLEGANDAEKAANAKKFVTEQKLGEEINKWFVELQGKVKVENYLEIK